ncbi:MAG: hypothetical protein LAO51_16490 [Acidobacteriia bacterium]|nr:hypothetical protein [Terriglobia bacterium]
MDFFEKHRAVWETIYKNAYEYAGKYIKAPAKLRQDDVIEALVPALQVTELLGNTLRAKRLLQKYWVRYFADLIVDSLWT